MESYKLEYSVKYCERFFGLNETGKISMKLLSLIDGKGVLPGPWSAERRVVGFMQTTLKPVLPRIVIDGYYGVDTQYALDLLLKVSLPKRTDNVADIPVISPFPSYNNISKFFGSLEEINSSIVIVNIPYKHILSYNPSIVINRVSCHKKIAELYVNVLEETLKVYGEKDIKALRLDVFGGGFYSPARRMRGGKLFSTHSWGIAFDYDPDRNTLRMDRNDAEFAKPDYREWLEAWNKVGAVSLGEVKNYDWMHFQFCKP